MQPEKPPGCFLDYCEPFRVACCLPGASLYGSWRCVYGQLRAAFHSVGPGHIGCNPGRHTCISSRTGTTIPPAATASSGAAACLSDGPSPTVCVSSWHLRHGYSVHLQHSYSVYGGFECCVGEHRPGETLTSDRVSADSAKIPFRRIQQWDLTELVPPQSVHDQMIDTRNGSRSSGQKRTRWSSLRCSENSRSW